MRERVTLTIDLHPADDVPDQWVARCVQAGVVTQGNSRDHALAMFFESMSIGAFADVDAGRSVFARKPAPLDTLKVTPDHLPDCHYERTPDEWTCGAGCPNDNEDAEPVPVIGERYRRVHDGRDVDVEVVDGCFDEIDLIAGADHNYMIIFSGVPAKVGEFLRRSGYARVGTS